MIEIERRYILSGLPDENIKYIFEIVQYYLNSPDKDIHRIRSSKENSITKYYETFKSKIDEMSCEEIETEIDEKKFNELKLKANKVISKKRYVYYYKNLKFEVDDFENGLIICEVEIPNRDFEFSIPEGILENIVEEITGDYKYSNYKLAEDIKINNEE